MIKIIELVRSFNGNPVLQGINLEVPTGKITVVIGKSGAGKSVLLKHVAGLLRPDQGRIFIDGFDLTRARGRELQEIKKRFGVLFQGGALFDSLTVLENVAFPLREKTRLPEEEIFRRARQRLAQEIVLRGEGIVAVEHRESAEFMTVELGNGADQRIVVPQRDDISDHVLLG